MVAAFIEFVAKICGSVARRLSHDRIRDYTARCASQLMVVHDGRHTPRLRYPSFTRYDIRLDGRRPIVEYNDRSHGRPDSTVTRSR